MFFLLSKILAFLVKPLVWIELVLLFAWFFRKRKAGKRLALGALFLFLLFSNEALFLYVRHWYEVPFTKPESVEKHYNYGILLSGMVYYNMTDSSAHLGEGGDRLMQTILLYQEKKIDKIIVSGGSASLNHQSLKEADAIARVLYALQIDSQDVILDRSSRNTAENAQNTAELLKSLPPGNCLLISSATHLPRAIACFRKCGLNPDLFATDPSPGLPGSYIGKWLIPKWYVLLDWQVILHEWIGFIAYRLKGYC